MDKQTKLLIGIAAAVAVYMIFKPKISTSSPAADKMKLACAKGEQLADDGKCYPATAAKPILATNTTSSTDVPDLLPFNGFKNYVDTKQNEFFQPEMGHFYKKG